jgi:hypothetical protein
MCTRPVFAISREADRKKRSESEGKGENVDPLTLSTSFLHFTLSPGSTCLGCRARGPASPPRPWPRRPARAAAMSPTRHTCSAAHSAHFGPYTQIPKYTLKLTFKASKQPDTKFSALCLVLTTLFCPPSAVCYLLSTVCRLLSAVFYPLSAVCYLSRLCFGSEPLITF